jgi:para-nitrobenzyl esterase
MIDRRTFLGCGTLAVTGLLLDDSSLYSGRGDAGPTVVTTAGKVRGITAGKVHAFKGIPYGASTEGSPIPPRASAAALDGPI